MTGYPKIPFEIKGPDLYLRTNEFTEIEQVDSCTFKIRSKSGTYTSKEENVTWSKKERTFTLILSERDSRVLETFLQQRSMMSLR